MKPFYSRNDANIYNCRARSLLESLETKSVALAFLDPPYFRVKPLWWDRQWRDAESFLDWIDEICQSVKRVLTPNGSLYLCASPVMTHQVESIVRQYFNILNVIRWYKEAGWHKKARVEDLRSFLEPWETIIFAEQWWTDKNAAGESGYFQECKALHKQVYAPIGRYIQQERERAGLTRNDVEVALGYISSSDPMRGTALCYRWEEGSNLPTADAYSRLRQLLNERGNHHGGEYLRRDYEELRRDYEYLRRDYEELRRPFSLNAERPTTDLWTYTPVPPDDTKHPTEKPLAMLSNIVETSSRPGDLVLDCFLGRGATAVAAVQHGRRFVGCDIQRTWCTATVARLKEAQGEFHIRPRRNKRRPPLDQLELFAP